MADGTLGQAAYEGSVPKVQLLLAQEEDAVAALTAKDADQRTSLHWACAGGHMAVVELIASKLGGGDALEATLNALDDQGWSPLMSAASAGHLAVAEYVLARGGAPSANALSNDGRVPLHYHKGLAPMAALLLPRMDAAHVARADRYGSTPLHRAASVGGEAVARLLLAHERGGAAAALAARDAQGNTPLHLAVIHRHERLARMLLEAGADPRARNGEGKTPIALGSDELVKDATALYGGGGGGGGEN